MATIGAWPDDRRPGHGLLGGHNDSKLIQRPVDTGAGDLRDADRAVCAARVSGCQICAVPSATLPGSRTSRPSFAYGVPFLPEERFVNVQWRRLRA
jgi:hypothetical protein